MTDNSTYYYIDSNKTYKKSNPHPTSNLIGLFGLSSIANTVARLNEDGTKGVKLRKSYKAHIAELEGKYDIPKDRTLSPIVFAPEREGAPIIIKELDQNMLDKCLHFQRTSENGVPGFDIAKLGLGDPSQSLKRKQKNREDDSKRRRLDF